MGMAHWPVKISCVEVVCVHVSNGLCYGCSSMATVMLIVEMHVIGTAAINNRIIFMAMYIYTMCRHYQGYLSPYLCDLDLVYSFV